jgi:hypothetical protein
MSVSNKNIKTSFAILGLLETDGAPTLISLFLRHE